jgi:hypothetical protein
MRKLLVHIFWGVYTIRLGKRKLTFLRSSTVLFPSLLVAALAQAYKIHYLFLGIFIFGALVDFAYLKFFPPVWKELSGRQKASLPPGDVLNSNWYEYITLKDKYE